MLILANNGGLSAAHTQQISSDSQGTFSLLFNVFIDVNLMGSQNFKKVDSYAQSKSITGLTEQCLRYVQINGFDVDSQENILTTAKFIPSADCNSTNSQSHIDKSTYISFANNNGQEIWGNDEIKGDQSLKLTPIIGDTTMLIVAYGSVPTLSLYQLSKDDGSLMKESTLSFAEALDSELQSVSVFKAQQDQYYIAATLSQSQLPKSSLSYICKLESHLSNHQCFQALPIADSLTSQINIRDIKQTENSIIVSLDYQHQNEHYKSLQKYSLDSFILEKEFNYKFNGELLESKMILSQDSKTLFIADIRENGVWISHGCACSLTMNSFVSTNIRGQHINLHFIENSSIVVITVELRDTNTIQLFKYDISTLSLTQTSTCKSTIENQGLIGRSHIHSQVTGQTLVISKNSKAQQSIAYEKVILKDLKWESNSLIVLTDHTEESQKAQIQSALITFSKINLPQFIASESVAQPKNARKLLTPDECSALLTQELPMITVNMGADPTVSPAKTIQDYSVYLSKDPGGCGFHSIEMFYNTKSMVPEPGEFITILTADAIVFEIVVDTVNHIATPSLRFLYLYVCESPDDNLDDCVIRIQYIQIIASPAPSQNLMETCSSSPTWPKVFGYQDGSIDIYEADYQGTTMLICGQIDTTVLQDKQYPIIKKKGIIALTVPDSQEFQWTYTVSNIRGSTDSYMSSCKFRTYNTTNLVIALLNVGTTNGNKQVIYQFNKDTGAFIFSRSLPDIVQLQSNLYNNIYVGMQSITTQTTIYLTGRQYQSGNLYIQRMSITDNDARFDWYNTFTINSALNQSPVHDLFDYVDDSNNRIYFTSHVKMNNSITSDRQVLARMAYDGSSVTQVDKSAKVSEDDYYKLSLAYGLGNIYWSTANFEYYSSTITKTLSKFGSDLTFTSSRSFSLPLSNSYYISDLFYYTGTDIICEQFTISKNRYYIALYNQDLTLRYFKGFYQSKFDITHLNIFAGSTGIYSVYSTKNLINDLYYAVSFDKFDLDLKRVNNKCLYWDAASSDYQSSVSTQFSNNGLSLTINKTAFSQMTTNQLMSYYYVEAKNQTTQVFFKEVQTQGTTNCAFNGFNQIEQNINTVVFTQGESSQIIAVLKPILCPDHVFSNGKMQIYYPQETKPAFLDSSNLFTENNTHYIINFSNASTPADLGLYEVVIKYEETQSGKVRYQNIPIQIYPKDNYGQNVLSFECADVGLTHYDTSRIPLSPSAASFNTENTIYAVCGEIYDTPQRQSIYVEFNTLGGAILAQNRITSSNFKNSIVNCEFLNQDTLYVAVNSITVDQDIPKNGALIYEIGSTGKVSNAKQLTTLAQNGIHYLNFETADIVRNKDFMIVTGSTNTNDYGSNTPSGFIAVINLPQLNVQFFRSYAPYSTTFDRINFWSVAYDAQYQRIFAALQPEGVNDNSIRYFSHAIMSVDSNTGDLKWAQILDPSNITANQDAESSVIAHRGKYYGCFSNSVVDAASVKHEETMITMINYQFGSIIDQLEVYADGVEQHGCSITSQEDLIIIAINTYTQTDNYATRILFFDGSYNVTNTLARKYNNMLVFKPTTKMNPYHVQLEISGGKLNLFMFSSFGESPTIDNLFRAIVDKFDTDSSLNWYKKCSSIQQVSDQANAFLGQKNGYGDSSQDIWVQFKLNSIIVDTEFIYNQFTTISGIKATILQNEGDTKSQYEQCNWRAFPLTQNQNDYSCNVNDELNTITLKPAQQCQNLAISNVITQLNNIKNDTLPSFMTFNATTNQITFTANSNEFVGNHILKLNNFVTGDTNKFDNDVFNIKIAKNSPPQFKSVAASDSLVTIRNDEKRRWTFEVENDDNDDIANFDVEVFDVDGYSVNSTFGALLVTDYTATKITFEIFNTSVPSKDDDFIDYYTVRVYLFDKFNNDKASASIEDIKLTVVKNHLPQLVLSDHNYNLQTIKVAGGNITSQTIANSWFTDDGSYSYVDDLGVTQTVNDQVVLIYNGVTCDGCTATNPTSWLTVTQSSNTVLVSGTVPNSNSYKGIYKIQVQVGNQYNGPFDTRIFTITVIENKPVAVVEKHITSLFHFVEPKSYSYGKLDTYCYDPQGDTLSYNLIVSHQNDYSSPLTDAEVDAIFSYDRLSTSPTYTSLAFNFLDNKNAGTYYIKYTCQDLSHDPVVGATFVIEAIANAAVQKVGTIPNFTVRWDRSEIEIPQKLKDYFSDLEGFNLTPTLSVIKDEVAVTGLFSLDLGKSLFRDYVKFTNATSINAGTYLLTITATDDAPQSNTQQFTVTLTACENDCDDCDDATPNVCKKCNSTSSLFQGQCVDTCDQGYYRDSIQNSNSYKCSACPAGCQVCSGPDRTSECSACKSGYYFQDGGCFKTCAYATSYDPVAEKVTYTGYYPDTKTNTCLPMPDRVQARFAECQSSLQIFQDTNSQSRAVEFPDQPDQFIGQQVSCSGMSTCFGGIAQQNQCSWERKFSVKCGMRPSTGTITLQVTTNAMPDHCMYIENAFPQETLISFEVAFSLKPSILKTLKIASQTDADNYLCSNNWLEDSNLRSIYEYSGNFDTKRNQIIGVATNGVPIYSGTSELKYDAFYPKAYGLYKAPRAVNVDVCLGSVGTTGFYKYYSYSPCMLPGSAQLPNPIKTRKISQACSEDPQCATDPFAFVQANEPYVYTTIKAQKTVLPIGIARDGHYIIAPFKEDGTLWQPCDVDQCNGVILHEEYMYVSTFFHPYTASCWGPSGTKSYVGSCTTSSKRCVGASSGLLGDYSSASYLSALYSAIIAVFALLFINLY